MRRWTLFALVVLLTACTPDEPVTIGFLQGDFAFVAYQNSVQVVDVSDPAQPEFVSQVTLPGEVVKVAADGRFAYIVHKPSVNSWDSIEGPPDSGLQIVEMSNPTQPKMQGFFRARNLATDVAVGDDVAYLSDWDRIYVVDIHNKNNPQSQAELPNGASSVIISGEQLFASWGGCNFRSGFCAGGLRIFDLADPTNPVETNNLQTDKLPGYDVAVANGYAFATGKGMWVTDLANEGGLMVNGRYEIQLGYLFPAKIVIQDNTVYALQQDGLHLLDISLPTTPTLLSLYPTPNYITDLTVRGQYAYLVGWSGLEIIDAADPANPWQMGYYGFANPIPNSPLPTATP